MYRVSKILNNNGVIAINTEDTRNTSFSVKELALERRSVSVLK